MNNFKSNNQKPPISEGEEVDVIVENVGEKGDGVAKIKGFVVFIPGVNKGDQVRIRIKKVLKSVAFADKIGEAEKPVEPSTPTHSRKDPADEIDFEKLGEGSEDFGEELED